MKTNHRRKNPPNSGFDYSTLNFQKRWRVGLSMDHDGGHRGSARDIKEKKTHEQRSKRKSENRLVQKELDQL